MKAAVNLVYGPPEVLQISEVAKPIPGDNEVLVKIMATSVNSGDVHLRKADPFAVRFFFGLMKPRLNILGGVFSGVIEATGKNVKLFKKGDNVFGHTDMKFGAYAEYKCFPENGTIALKPANLSFEEAAVIPFGGTTALHFIKKASIKHGQKVLVYGASGSVGSSAIQLAKNFGAEVTAVCSTSNVDLMKSLGADKVIDYKKEDFTKNGETYDVIYETVNKLPVSTCIKSLSKTGTLILGAAGMSEMMSGIKISMTGQRKVLSGLIKHNQEAINFLKTLAEAGKLKPVIDRNYPLEKIAEAHTYVEQGHKKGNVAIIVNEQNPS